MYAVSPAFLKAVQASTRRYHWNGKLTTKDGAVYDFDDTQILKGSGSILWQCAGSSEIELGSVYAGELSITLRTNIDRYTLADAKIEMFYSLRLEDGSNERIPMGVYEVTEANRSGSHLELKAYDYMLRFDKSFRGFESNGTAYDLIEFCCQSCGVDFAASREEIEALPNGEYLLSIYEDNDIETFRDLLYYTGQVLGGFFAIGRTGLLEFRRYSNTPVQELDTRQRFSSSISDFVTRYSAVSSTNKRTQIAEYYALETDDALTMNLGINPLLQLGLEKTRETLCRNILSDLSVINYVPFDSDTIGNPALDVGDVIRLSGGQADETRLSVINRIEMRIGGKQSLQGVGKNPRLAGAKSKNDKNISGLLSQIETNRESGVLALRSFTNASAYQIGASREKIISIEFATTQVNTVQFLGQVIVDVAADQKSISGLVTVEGTDCPVSIPIEGRAEVIFTFELNNELIHMHQPVETWGPGKHTILLYYPIDGVIPEYNNTFNVYMQVDDGSASIEEGGCVASVFGQSMAATDAWDGRIEVEESFPVLWIKDSGSGFLPRVYTEAMTTSSYPLETKAYTDQAPRVAITALIRDEYE